MNSDELQNPQPIGEPLQPLQQNRLDKDNQENLPVESSGEISQENSTMEPEIENSDNVALGEFVAPVSESQPTESEFQDLRSSEQKLQDNIKQLQDTYNTLQAQVTETQIALAKIVKESLSDIEQRKQTLQISVEQLERRQERIRNEMRTTFAGASQDLAIRVQGFKDYLIGSLQDLAASAEQLPLVPPPQQPRNEPERDRFEAKSSRTRERSSEQEAPQFAQQQFQDTTKQIRRLIDQYRTKPDYYGPAWQLRRTFEPIHAERVSNWFFTLGGRGALRTMGSRLQNTLISSAIISILYQLYDNRLRVLVLANTPERLGEWRRGLQDCLGIGRPDFGPGKGVALFESPEALAQSADRLVKSNQTPLILIDDSEEEVSLALLQFPLWLAFAPDPKMMRNYDDDF